MAELAIGIAAGIGIAAMCMIFYRKGVRDGMSMRKGAKVRGAAGDAGGDEEQNALMKKYEMIMNYDPYGEHV